MPPVWLHRERHPPLLPDLLPYGGEVPLPLWADGYMAASPAAQKPYAAVKPPPHAHAEAPVEHAHSYSRLQQLPRRQLARRIRRPLCDHLTKPRNCFVLPAHRGGFEHGRVKLPADEENPWIRLRSRHRRFVLVMIVGLDLAGTINTVISD